MTTEPATASRPGALQDPTSLPRALRRAVRRPAVHFALLGGLLFGIQDRFLTPEAAPLEPVVISASQVEQLRRGWLRHHGKPPTASEQNALLDDFVTEELLFREALRRGLDRADLVIYRRLTQKMRLLAEDPDRPVEDLYREARELGLDRDDVIVRRRLVQQMKLRAEAEGGAVRPTEGEIESHYRRHREEYRLPGRTRFTHVFLSRQRYGARLEREGSRLLEELDRDGVPPEDAPSRGEAFLLGHHLVRTAVELDRGFGPGFAERLTASQPGVWTAVESSYGLHLVRVHEVVPETTAELEAARPKVLRSLVAAQKRKRYESFLDRLRLRYPVRVGPPARAAAGGME